MPPSLRQRTLRWSRPTDHTTGPVSHHLSQRGSGQPGGGDLIEDFQRLRWRRSSGVIVSRVVPHLGGELAATSVGDPEHPEPAEQASGIG
jgi:hypothetical protein